MLYAGGVGEEEGGCLEVCFRAFETDGCEHKTRVIPDEQAPESFSAGEDVA